MAPGLHSGRWHSMVLAQLSPVQASNQNNEELRENSQALGATTGWREVLT